MTTEIGFGEMFKCDSADIGAGKFPLMSIGGRAEGLAGADPGVMTPIGVSGNYIRRSRTIGHYVGLAAGQCMHSSWSNSCLSVWKSELSFLQFIVIS